MRIQKHSIFSPPIRMLPSVRRLCVLLGLVPPPEPFLAPQRPCERAGHLLLPVSGQVTLELVRPVKGSVAQVASVVLASGVDGHVPPQDGGGGESLEADAAGEGWVALLGVPVLPQVAA